MLRDKQTDYRQSGSIYLLTDDNDIRAKIVLEKDKNYHYREGAFWNSETKRMISVNVHIQDIYIDFSRDRNSYSYGRYRDAYVDDKKSLGYALKRLFFRTDDEQFKDYNKFDKYCRDFKIEDKLLEEFVEQKWNEQKANLKSILGVMSLGLGKGQSFSIYVEGGDEEEVLQEIDQYLKSEGLVEI